MTDTIVGQSVTFRIEVESSPPTVLLVFDRASDSVVLPWEEAFHLAEVMAEVARDVRSEFTGIVDPMLVMQQQAQVRMSYDRGLVMIVTPWTDRLRFSSLESWGMVALALRRMAQDAHWALRGVHFQYTRDGMIKRVHNSKNGVTQLVR